MYAYCGNNPVNRFDPNGTSWLSNIVKAVVNVVKTVVNAINTVKAVVNTASAVIKGATGATGTTSTQKTVTSKSIGGASAKVTVSSTAVTSTTGVLSGKPIEPIIINRVDKISTSEVGIRINANRSASEHTVGLGHSSMDLFVGKTYLGMTINIFESSEVRFGIIKDIDRYNSMQYEVSIGVNTGGLMMLVLAKNAAAGYGMQLVPQGAR